MGKAIYRFLQSRRKERKRWEETGKLLSTLLKALETMTKRVETFTLITVRTIRVIQVSASPPPSPQAKLFRSPLGIKLKGSNIEKGGRGGRGTVTSFELEKGFEEEEVKFPLSVSTSATACSSQHFSMKKTQV